MKIPKECKLIEGYSVSEDQHLKDVITIREYFKSELRTLIYPFLIGTANHIGAESKDWELIELILDHIKKLEDYIARPKLFED